MTRVRGLAVVAVVLVLASGGWWWVRTHQRVPAAHEDAMPPVPIEPDAAGVSPPAPTPPPVADVSEVPTPPGSPALMPVHPPAALRVPFRVGETALYDVAWLGLGAGLSAGTAEFVVRDGGAVGGAGYRIDLTAATAPWVSTFFEAYDRFWTFTTPDLYPLEHRQELHEGRRRVSRTARFDRAAGLVRVGDGPLDSPSEGVSRALLPSTRDPLSAMYYVRTLDWEHTTERRLIVSDLGLDLGVDVRAGRSESVTAQGRAQPARRLTVRMEYLTAKYPTPKATVWLSVDARRVPLVVEVETDVGMFRMALVRYAATSMPAPPAPRWP